MVLNTGKQCVQDICRYVGISLAPSFLVTGMKVGLCHCTAEAHPSPFLIFSRTTTHTLSLFSRRTKSALSLTMSGIVMTPNKKTTDTMPLKYNNTSSRRRSIGLELRNFRAVLSWADPTKPLPMNATINVPMTICRQNIGACSSSMLCGFVSHVGPLRLCTVYTELAHSTGIDKAYGRSYAYSKHAAARTIHTCNQTVLEIMCAKPKAQYIPQRSLGIVRQ